MVKHIIVVFIAIAVLAYYFDVDLRAWVDRYGPEKWFGTSRSENQSSSTPPVSNL